MKKNLSTKVRLTSVFVFIGALLLFGCEKDEQYSYDPSIADSPEMEDYIIAAADLHESLVIFQSELAKVDFSNLETVIEDGREVRYLPGSIRSLNIEQKKLLMNEKKEILQQKFPELTFLSIETISKVLDKCSKNSIRVNDRFLKLGINASLPMTRSSSNEGYNTLYNTHSDAMLWLGSYVGSSNYVEVVVIVYTDGKTAVYTDSRNTKSSCWYPSGMRKEGGDFYYSAGGSNSPIYFIAHTHLNGSSASDRDKETKINGLNEAVYYNGAFFFY